MCAANSTNQLNSGGLPAHWVISFRSVAFVVDMITMNKFFVTAVSVLVNTQSHLQIKVKCKLSRTPMNRPSVPAPVIELIETVVSLDKRSDV